VEKYSDAYTKKQYSLLIVPPYKETKDQENYNYGKVMKNDPSVILDIFEEDHR